MIKTHNVTIGDKPSWKRPVLILRDGKQLIAVPITDKDMTPEQLITAICKECKLPFTLAELDNLAILCHQYYLRSNEITKP